MKHLSIVLIALLSGVLACVASDEGQRFVLYDPDTAPPDILVADNISGDELADAVTTLARILASMSGKSVEKLAEPAPDDAVRTIRLELVEADEVPDGAHVVEVTPQEVCLKASRSIDLAFSIYTLLQDYIGVRWYAPGEAGEVIPQRDTVVLPVGCLTHEPEFSSRMYAGGGTLTRQWLLRNRLEMRDRFGHSLYMILPQERSKDTALDAESFAALHAQPDYSDAENVKLTADYVRRYFQTNPKEKALALSMNDSDDFSALSAYEETKWFEQKPDFSTPVFRFYNEVAQELEGDMSGVRLGVYAYRLAVNVPDFALHPMLRPYLVRDRMRYHDEAFAERDKALMQRWSEKAQGGLGVYDYYYGEQYLMPRVSHRIRSEVLTEIREAHVRAWYFELYPLWAYNGADAWAMAYSAWNPDSSYESLIDNYYDGYYGAAANSVKHFFEIAEQAWLAQRGKSRWLEYYEHVGILALYSPDVRDKMQQALAEAAHVLEKSGEADSCYSQHLDDLRQLFSVSCALADLYEEWIRIHQDATMPLNPFLEAREKVKTLQETEMPARWKGVVGYLYNCESALAMRVGSGVVLNDSELAALSKEDTKLYRAMMAESNKEARVTFRLLRDGTFTKLEQQIEAFAPFSHPLNNPDLTLGAWQVSASADEDALVSFDASEEGTTSLRFEKVDSIKLSQRVRVAGGETYLLKCYVRGKVSPGSAVQLGFFDSAGAVNLRQALLPPVSTEVWIPFVCKVTLSEYPRVQHPEAVFRLRWQEREDWLEIRDISLEALKLN